MHFGPEDFYVYNLQFQYEAKVIVKLQKLVAQNVEGKK